MNSDLEHIIEEAKELSQLIGTHDVTIRYKNSISALRNNVEAQEILEELISFGKEISESAGTASASAESALLKEKLDKNSLVKDYLTVQREYIYLLQNVLEKIKNPE